MSLDFSTRHVPILRDEILEKLAPAEGRFFIDGTLGGGGHARSFLDAGATVWGLDADEQVIERARVWGRDYKDRFKPVHANFAQLAEVLEGAQPVDGVLLDLGISSDQLDDPQRGLTYKAEGPLDMRLDQSAGVTVADIVNGWSEHEITKVLWDYAQEPKAKKIAQAIIKYRPLATTMDLLKVVEEVYPPRFGLKRSHPAARIFQAFRIAVNDEMGVLQEALEALFESGNMLNIGARVAVITFQPMEERLVKNYFRSLCQPELDDVGRQVRAPKYKMLPKVMPSKKELAENTRSHSAQLRVIEKLS